MKLKKLVENLMTTGQSSDPDEVPMAIADLKALAQMSQELLQYMEQNKPAELEGWVQSKITKASDYIHAIHKYFHYNPQQDSGCSSCGDGLDEATSNCCGRCGRFHVKGTSCPKPYLTGKRHCRNRPR